MMSLALLRGRYYDRRSILFVISHDERAGIIYLGIGKEGKICQVSHN